MKDRGEAPKTPLGPKSMEWVLNTRRTLDDYAEDVPDVIKLWAAYAIIDADLPFFHNKEKRATSSGLTALAQHYLSSRLLDSSDHEVMTAFEKYVDRASYLYALGERVGLDCVAGHLQKIDNPTDPPAETMDSEATTVVCPLTL